MIFFRSSLTFSGMTQITRYPFCTPTKVNPMPVFPDVASMIVIPGFSLPSFCAASMTCLATRSLILPPGLRNSALAYTFPEDSPPNRIRGTLPMASKIESRGIKTSLPQPRLISLQRCLNQPDPASNARGHSFTAWT